MPVFIWDQCLYHIGLDKKVKKDAQDKNTKSIPSKRQKKTGQHKKDKHVKPCMGKDYHFLITP